MRSVKLPSSQLFAVLRRRLKAQSLTYRDIAHALHASEISVKRWFSQENLTIKRLAILAELLGMTIVELMQEAEDPPLQQLTLAQEQELTGDSRLLLVASCAMNHMSLNEITEQYALTEAECIKYLLVLDRLRMIDLLPQNRIRLRVARDFESLRYGPLWKFTRGKAMKAFLDNGFNGKNEDIMFLHAMLTPAAIKRFQEYAYRLKQKMSELHQESLHAPISHRRHLVAYLAYREWELEEFAALRRNADSG